MKKNRSKFSLLVFGLYASMIALQAQPAKVLKPNDSEVAVAWAEVTVQLMTKAIQNTPTYGSRALGYIGLTMYETVVFSSPKHRPVAGTICDTLSLPKPKKEYSRELALNAGQAYIIKAFYGYANKNQSVDSLEKAIYERYASLVPAGVAEASVKYGKKVASRIYQWSKSDGGHDGYSRNFPKDYVLDQGRGIWVPPVVGQSNSKIPMHPTWGANRTFSRKNALLPLPKPLEYSTDSNSECYLQYKKVLDRKRSLTEEERAIVMWWGDDPTETCSPPGHSYHLATIAVRNGKADLVKAAETYARIGMAVADAFICCWKTKFTYMVERPSSYIKKKIRVSEKYPGELRRWLPFFLEPPFPSFYSGHAVQSAATATVLTEMYGSKVAFVDDTHAARAPKPYLIEKPLPEGIDLSRQHYYMPEYMDREMVFLPRRYASFWEAAQECANSRLMGGIHTRHDNEVGLADGTKIGKNINTLLWH
ncbi:MAG: vanadium-dependent haloperoxidase [Spirosomataceae bacterium]